MTDSELQQNPLPAEEVSDEKESDLFASNYAMAIALGLPFGMMFGLLILDDITWGLLIGLGLAPIIAMVMTRIKANE